MYRIGIDVGSTWTKFCIVQDGVVKSMFMEKTPVRQKEYFCKKILELQTAYAGAEIVSCGYGKRNVTGLKTVNELTALAKAAILPRDMRGLSWISEVRIQKLSARSKGGFWSFLSTISVLPGAGCF